MNNMTNWYDYYNHEMVSLPPVGEIVFTNAGEEIFKVKILEHTFNGVSNIAVCRVIDDSINPNLGRLGYYQHFYPLDWNKVELKNKLIFAVYDNMTLRMADLTLWEKLDILYDQGYLKFPEDK